MVTTELTDLNAVLSGLGHRFFFPRPPGSQAHPSTWAVISRPFQALRKAFFHGLKSLNVTAQVEGRACEPEGLGEYISKVQSPERTAFKKPKVEIEYTEKGNYFARMAVKGWFL